MRARELKQGGQVLGARRGDRGGTAASRPPGLGHARNPRPPGGGRLNGIPGSIARARPHRILHGGICRSPLQIGPRSAAGLLAGQLAQIGAATGVPFRIVWSDGSAYWNSDAPPAFTLTFKTLGAEARVLRYGHVGVLEAYFDGGIDLEGNLAAAFHAGL